MIIVSVIINIVNAMIEFIAYIFKFSSPYARQAQVLFCLSTFAYNIRL